MNQSRELITGVSLVLAVGLGTTACSAEPQPTETGKPSPASYSAQLQQLAGNIIKLSNKAVNKSEGKPPHSLGFELPINDGGTMSFDVQSATSPINAGNIETIDIGQTLASGKSSMLSFYIRDDGTWSANCLDTITPETISVSEAGESDYTLGHKMTVTSPGLAGDILSSLIDNADRVVTVAEHITAGSAIEPVNNTCSVIIGDD